MKKVLLVVDMQEVCIGENHAKIFQYTNFFSDWRKFTYRFRFLAPLKNGKTWHSAWPHSPVLSSGGNRPHHSLQSWV